jgi:hypothetical protein
LFEYSVGGKKSRFSRQAKPFLKFIAGLWAEKKVLYALKRCLFDPTGIVQTTS